MHRQGWGPSVFSLLGVCLNELHENLKPPQPIKMPSLGHRYCSLHDPQSRYPSPSQNYTLPMHLGCPRPSRLQEVPVRVRLRLDLLVRLFALPGAVGCGRRLCS